MGVDKLKSAVFNLRNAFIGLGAGLVAKSFLDTAREVENLRVRFKFLFADAQEGEKAFKGLVKFAGQVPFSLAEIQRGSANLAVVSKNAEELNNLLKITGDIASASGLDFATTAEQIQRTFSSGINSADLFRERGVKALLGFEAGVQISAEESRKHILSAFEDGTLSVVGASEDMAKTFDGVMSMIGDKFLGFKMAMMDSAPFDFVKSGAMLIEKELSKNFGSIEKFAEKMGKSLVEGFENFLIMGARVLDNLQPIFSFLGKSIENLVTYVRALPAPFDTLGVIGFLMLGTKGKALVFLIGGVLDEIRSAIGHTIDAMAFMQEKMNSFSLFRSKQQIEDANKSIAELRETAERLKTPLTEVKDKFGEAGETGKTVFQELLIGTDENITKMGSYEEAIRKSLSKMKQLSTESQKAKEILDVGGFLSTREQVATQSMTGSELLGGASPQIVALQDMADMELEIAKSTADKKLSILDTFNQGFMKSLNEQKSAFTQIEDIGKQSFGKLKSTLTDFVMTGKLNFADLGKFVVRSFVEMLVGEAVKMAFSKSMAMFKMDAIKKAMISLYEGAMKTFASIPFPFNIVAVGGALAFGASLINKIKGFEKGGRPPVGQPSIVGEKGAELFVPDQAGTIVPNDKLGMGKQVTVNFNISTVDARGFNELLVNSRGTIVNMINNAVNEKGRVAII
jgi:hypothetical protein